MQVIITVRDIEGACADVEIEAPEPVRLATLRVALAEAGVVSSTAPLAVGGEPLRDEASLGQRGLRTGTILDVGPSGPLRRGADSILRLHVVGGPDCGQQFALPRGTHLVGRGHEARIAIDDPELSRRHLEVLVGVGEVSVRDAGSTNGTWIAGEPVGRSAQRVGFDVPIRVGSSTLAVSGVGEPPAAVTDNGNGGVSVSRPPRIVGSESGQEPVEFPAAPTNGSRPRPQWLMVLLPALLAVGLALAVHNPQFLAFALLTPATAAVSAVLDRREWRRSGRRRHAEHAAACEAAQALLDLRLAEEAQQRRRQFIDAAAVARTVAVPDCRLWERRVGDGDFLVIRLGLAKLAASTRARRGAQPIGDLVVADVPATVALADGPLGVVGPSAVADGVTRWLIVQLLTLHSYRDLSLVLLLDGPVAGWRWLRWPRAFLTDVATDQPGRQRAIAELARLVEHRRGQASLAGRWPGPWTVAVVVRARDAASSADLNTLLSHGPSVGVSAIFLDDDPRLLPLCCAVIAQVSSHTANLVELRGGPAGRQDDIRGERVSLEWADRIARQLAPLTDATADRGGELPQRVRLTGLLGDISAAALLTNWKAGRQPRTPIGVAASGAVHIDLARDGPHALIAGSTGSGKSELLRSLVAGLAATHAPDDLSFVLIDYKGGAAFAECAALPHTVGLVTDLDGDLTARALTSLDAELRRREGLLAAANATTLADYRRDGAAGRPRLPRLVIVVDEFATLADELPDFLSGLLGIAQRGRSLGVHLVLATQRPAGVVSPAIKANMALRICLRVTEPAESSDVIGSDVAARISKRAPGRGYALLADGLVEFQTALVATPARQAVGIRVTPLDDWNNSFAGTTPEPSDETELASLAAAACEAARQLGRPAPDKPWLEPLPEVLPASALPPPSEPHLVSYGLVDDPVHQRQHLLTHDLRDGGSIGIIGSAGSGRASAVRTFVGRCCDALDPDQLHVYLLDCSGRPLGSLARLAHCACAVSRENPELVARLVARLSAEVARRQRLLAETAESIEATGIVETDERRFDEARRHGRGCDLPRVLVVLAGWEGFDALSEVHDGGRSAASFLRLLRDAAAVGFTFLVTGDRGVLSVRVASALSTKLLLRLTDQADYAMAGVSPPPTRLPTGRAVTVDRGLYAQLAVLDSVGGNAGAQRSAIDQLAAKFERRRRPGEIRLRPLPMRAALHDIRGIGKSSAASGSLVLGVGGDEGEPLTVELPAHSRFLVVGPARSGRSTALLTLAEQAFSSGQSVWVAAPQRSPLAEWSRQRGLEPIEPTGALPSAHGPSSDPATAAPGDPTVAPAADLLIIDDVEQFTDTAAEAQLERLLRTTPVACLAAARSDELMISFRGIGSQLRRHRTGLLLQPRPVDGELLAVKVPPGGPLACPGRGLLITERTRAICADGIPVQVAC